MDKRRRKEDNNLNLLVATLFNNHILNLILFLKIILLFHTNLNANTRIQNIEVSSGIEIGGGVNYQINNTNEINYIGIFNFDFHVDVIWNRLNGYSTGVGITNIIGSRSFDDFFIGSGIITVLPVSKTFPIALSLVTYWRNDTIYNYAGIICSIWWGLRPHNYYFFYNQSAGIRLQISYEPSFANENNVDMLISSLVIDIDAAVILIYPWVYLYQLLV